MMTDKLRDRGSASAPAANHRILVVDDNESIHRDFRKILSGGAAEAEFDAEEAAVFGKGPTLVRRVPFQMDFALQGEQAFELVQAAVAAGERYAVAFVDMRMPPGWDGLKTTQKLWEVDPDLQIVICTAYSDYSWEEMIGAVGSPERLLILKKPFDTIEVLQFAHALTEKWSLLQAARSNTAALEKRVAERTAEIHGINVRLTREMEERKRAERSARQSEAELQTLVESIPQIVWITLPDGQHIHFNQQWFDYTGRTLEESLGDGWNPPFHPEDRARAAKRWQTSIDTGEVYEIEYRLRRTDGVYHWMLGRALPLRDGAGKIVKWFGTCTDIDELKQAEQMARENADKQRELAAQLVTERTRLLTAQRVAKVGDWQVDFISQVRTWSAETYRIFEAKPDDPVSHERFMEIVHPDDRSAVKAASLASLGGATAAVKHRLLMPDGRVKFVEQHWQVVCDEAGKAIQSTGTVQDVTEREEAQAILRRSERNLALAQRVSHTGSWEILLDPAVAGTARALHWSDEQFRIFGFEPGTVRVTEALFFELVHAQDRARVRAAFEAALQGGEPYDSEHRIVRPDGTEREVHELAEFIRDAESGNAVRIIGSTQDITERNAAKTALQKDQAFLAALVDNVSDGIVSCDAQGVITLFNRATREFHGLPAEPIPADRWAEHFSIFQPDGKTLMTKEEVPLFRALAEGVVQDAEMVIAPREGKTRRIVAAGRAFFDEAGEKIGAVVAMHDVTEARKAEEELRASEAALVLAQQVAHLGSWEMDLDSPGDLNGNALRWSDETFRIFGFEPDAIEVTNSAFFDCVHPDDRDGVVAGIAELLRSGGRYSLDHRIILPNGRERTVHGEATVIFAENPRRALKVAGTVLDITERKAAEEQLREQAQMLELAHDAIVVRRVHDRVITFWNAGAERLYGWTAEEAVGQPMGELIFDDREHYEAIAKASEETGYRGEVRQVTKDGRALIVNAGATVIRDSDGTPHSVLIIQTDITDHKKLESQFLRAQRLESIGTLASGVAHDLNNVLAPILMSAPLLRDELPDGLKEKIIDTIESSAERGAQIVRQVLTFARGVEGERVMLDPRHLIKEMTEIAGQTFPKSIKLTSTVSDDLAYIEGDPTQLHQVLLNLAVNARDAMPDGGKLTLSAQNFEVDEQYAAMTPGTSVGPYVLISVADTGTGIPAHVLEKMFDPFFTTKGIGKGTGLGLSTVLGIVQSHHGTINAYSTPSGTTFRVLLPATQGLLDLQAAVVDLPQGSGETVLVVDDEVAIRDVAKVMLERNGYQVLVADDGPSALALFAQRQSEITLVLTDYLMPIMNGLALARILRKMNPRAQIVLSSGRADDCSAAEMEASGVTALLTKPYTKVTLLRTLHRVHQEGRQA